MGSASVSESGVTTPRFWTVSHPLSYLPPMLFQPPKRNCRARRSLAFCGRPWRAPGAPALRGRFLAGMRAEHLREAARLSKLGLMLLASKIERAAIVLIETRRKGSVMRGLAHCARS